MPLSTFNPAAQEGTFKEIQFGVPHNINANIQLTMPLYNPQIYGAIETAKIASELSELNYRKTEEQVFFEISNLYYNAQILQHQLNFLDSNLMNAESLLKNMQLLNQQLLAKGTDVSRLKLQVAQLTNQRDAILNKYLQVLNLMKFNMGIALEQRFQVEPEIKIQSAKDYSLSTTLDTRLINTQYRLLSRELSTLNKTRYFPSINLFGTYGTVGFGYSKQPNDFLKFYPIGFTGIQFYYNVFNGTITQRKINQKKLELKNNELQLSLSTEQNKVQVENAKMQRNIAENAVETTTAQIVLAETIYEQTLLQHQQGTASLTDVLLADNILREAQQNKIAALVDFLKADLELKKSTGNILNKTNN
jgi:OMF family outer membrane factor